MGSIIAFVIVLGFVAASLCVAFIVVYPLVIKD